MVFDEKCLVVKGTTIVGCNNKEITELIIPDGITVVAESAFEDCIYLRRVVIPSSVARICAGAFKNCSRVEEFVIPNRIIWEEDVNSSILVEGNAFEGCADNIITTEYDTICVGYEDEDDTDVDIDYNAVVTRIEIPYGVKLISEICAGVFSEFCNLREVILSDSVISMYDMYEEPCVRGCAKLESIQLSAAMEDIPSCAFSDCKMLRNIEIPFGIKRIYNFAFENCDSLENLVLPNSVEYIDDYAFTSCRNLKSIEIPDSVIAILELNEYDSVEEYKQAVVLGDYIEHCCFDDCPNVVIRCYEGSYIDTYAKKWGIKVEYMS